MIVVHQLIRPKVKLGGISVPKINLTDWIGVQRGEVFCKEFVVISKPQMAQRYVAVGYFRARTEPSAARLATAATRSLGATGLAMWVW